MNSRGSPAPCAQDKGEHWRHVHRVVRRSRSSFFWGMRILPAERRRAMYAIYAFCREVDDIADLPGEAAVKQVALAAWRDEIGRLFAGRPQRPTTRALYGPVQRFDLPREEFLALIDGVELDTAPVVRMRTLTDLLAYCRNVAGSVGMLSVHAFSIPAHPGPRIAETLGNALQLTNILRDLAEDAAADRLYLPQDLLAGRGIDGHSAQAALEHPRFDSVCAELSELARSYFAEAEALIVEIGSRKLRAAVVMMTIYRETLDRLEVRGWHDIGKPIRLTATRKMWLALRHGFLQP